MTRVLVVFAMIASLAALAARTARAAPCASTEVQAARATADAQIKAGKFRDALTTLDEVAKRCAAGLAAEPRLWLQSDLTFAAYKAGDRARCVAIFHDVDGDAAAKYPKVAKALLYNARLCAPKDDCDYKLDSDEPVCQMRLAIEYSKRNELADFAAVPCAIAGHPKAVQLGPGRCVELGEFAVKPDYDATCPTVSVITSRANAKPVRRTLTGGDGWMTTPSDCCAVQQIATRIHAGKSQLLISSGGPTRDCFGGTATSDYAGVFELRGDVLDPVADYTVGWH